MNNYKATNCTLLERCNLTGLNQGETENLSRAIMRGKSSNQKPSNTETPKPDGFA